MKLFSFIGLSWCCLTGHAALAQQRVSSTDILATVKTDRGVTLQDNQIDYYQQHIKSLYFLDQVSLRTRTDEFDWARQDYAARLDVNGLGKLYRSRGLQQADLETVRAQKADLFHSALLERYSLLARYFSLEKEVAIRRKLKVITEDKIRVLEQIAAYSAAADPEEMMKTDFEKDDIVIKISENESEMAQIKAIFAIFFGSTDSLQIDTANVISTDRMLLLLNGQTDSINTNPGIFEKEAKIAKIRAEYHLEEAKQLQTLDFIQLRYSQRNNPPLFNKFDIAVGLTLPYNASSRVKKSELFIEQHAAEQELTLYREKLQRLVVDNFQALKGLQSQRLLIQQQITDSRNRYAPEKNTSLQKNGVSALLQFNELLLKRSLRITEIDREIASRYLEILYLTGRMSEQPLLNYLRNDLAGF
jgi:hypothetical protein